MCALRRAPTPSLYANWYTNREGALNTGLLTTLTPEQVYKRLQDGQDNIMLVDIRNQQEWLYDGRISGADWIPMHELPGRASELPRDRDVILYCAHGVCSKAMTRYFTRAGFDNVIDMEGGLQAWANAGLPVKHR